MTASKPRWDLLGYLRNHRFDEDRWNPSEDAQWRELVSVGNDGIISSAAIVQGLLTAGATGQEAVTGVLALIAIGMVGSGASQYSESESERRSQLSIVERESAALLATPDEEFDELVTIYEEKGLSADLSRAVATELMAKDALTAQLDAEYGLDSIHGKWWPWQRAGLAALVFLVGSVLPLLFLLILPWAVRGEVTVAAVVIALGISGWIGHLVEHSSAWRAMARTILVGVTILGISTLAGTLVTF